MKIFRNSAAAAVLIGIIFGAIGYLAAGTTSAQELIAAASSVKTPSGTYNFDKAHTVIGFGVGHLGIAIVEGRFKDFSGSVDFDEKDATRSTVEFTAKIESIDTGVAPRDTHLKSADFFDAAKFPSMSFKSTKVQRKGKSHELTGDLTIKGVTKQVTLPFTMTDAIKDPWGGTRFGIHATTTINRRDFGINYGNALPGGGLDVANEVAIELHLEAVKQAPKPASAD
jgi:polyisoprenoid-binding protein YceI